jgi:hypothetical protein
MASVNQTRPYCVNQMGKTHSKPLEARHVRGTVWARHAMCESALTVAAKLDVVTVVLLNINVFWDVTPTMSVPDDLNVA